MPPLAKGLEMLLHVAVKPVSRLLSHRKIYKSVFRKYIAPKVSENDGRNPCSFLVPVPEACRSGSL
jgi:hypothetical protein